jgi:hypothetical protein
LERVEIFTFLDGEKTAEMYRDLKWEEGREGGVRGNDVRDVRVRSRAGASGKYCIMYYTTVLSVLVVVYGNRERAQAGTGKKVDKGKQQLWTTTVGRHLLTVCDAVQVHMPYIRQLQLRLERCCNSTAGLAPLSLPS